jgi:hypothetical protein
MVQSSSRVAKTDRMVSCIGPLPFYTAEQYTDMKAASVIPLSLALFVTSLFFVTLGLGGKKLQTSTNPKLIFCVGSAAVYCCVDLFPMVAVENVGCTPGVVEYEKWGSLPACLVQRCSVHFMQSSMYWLAAMLFDLASVAVLNWNQKSRDIATRVWHGIAWGVPLICMACTYGLDEPFFNVKFRFGVDNMALLMNTKLGEGYSSSPYYVPLGVANFVRGSFR